MINPTPTANSGLPTRHADFRTIAEALDYAALGVTGINFYDAKLALVEALPYHKLREQAWLLAHKLLGAGLQPGDRVGLIAENDGDFTRAFYACQYAGLIPAPLPLPAAFGGRQNYIAHLRRMLQTASANALFGPSVLSAWLLEAAEGLDLKFTGTLQMLAPVTPISGGLPSPDENALGYLQFSSGSTRFPAGIAVTQRAFMANARGIGKHGLAIGEGDRAASWLPFYHDMGLVGFFLLPMACQSTVDILSPRDFARPRHHRLQPVFRLRAVHPPRRNGRSARSRPLQLAQRRDRRRHDPAERAGKFCQSIRTARLWRRRLCAKLRHGGGDPGAQFHPARAGCKARCGGQCAA
jgi:fatty-acyl-CoA synthase